MQKDYDAKAGVIVASFGQRGILESESGKRIKYQLKGRKLRAVCGDIAQWTLPNQSNEALVHKIISRGNSLTRPNSRGQEEVIASNLNQIIVVSSPKPMVDLFLIDRFLCAAEILNINAAIIWNKNDLQNNLPEEFHNYSHIGYEVLSASVKYGNGVERIKRILAEGTSILVGQSGVGKSSLINRLIPEAYVIVKEISSSNQEGKHTTTASIMHKLTSGGRLIDSPGVREFTPIFKDQLKIQTGFREIFAKANNCKFKNCLHLREPSCAIKESVIKSEISQRRYKSYKRLCNSAIQFKN
ncbi:MAG: ribosome small subunit-dependent GTPase A [Pseudomonadota bacterium]|nr:ribosome small subunit-dependent GTPase A [Pseudomonadota bacterium]